jgi:hypothetical protein
MGPTTAELVLLSLISSSPSPLEYPYAPILMLGDTFETFDMRKGVEGGLELG